MYVLITHSKKTWSDMKKHNQRLTNDGTQLQRITRSSCGLTKWWPNLDTSWTQFNVQMVFCQG